MGIREDLKAKFITTYRITQADYTDWLENQYFKSDAVSANWENIAGRPVEINYTDSMAVSAVRPILDTLDGNGVVSGISLSINSDNTKFNIAPGIFHVLADGNISYPGASGISVVSFVANTTYIALDFSGNVIQQSTPFTMDQRRVYIILGVLIHSNHININTINNLPDVAVSTASQFNDLLDSLRNFNYKGNIFSANGANLNINKSAGEIFKKGVNFQFDVNNPHIKTLDSLVAPTNIRYRLSTGVEYSDTALIEGYYELGGVRTVIPPNKFSIQRIAVFSSNLIRIQYGQATYGSIALAEQGILSEPFIVEPNIAENGLFRCYLIVRSAVTDLSDITQAKFVTCDKWGEAPLGAAGGITTLQQAYVNSAEPEITTNISLGAVSIRRGSVADTDKVFEVQNGAGASVFSVTGEGNINGTIPVSGVDGLHEHTNLPVLEHLTLGGFTNRTDSIMSITASAGGFTVTLTGTYEFYADNKEYIKTNESITKTSAIDKTPYYIWYDSTGTLNVGGAWTITPAIAMVAGVYYDNGLAILYDERHSADRNVKWHSWAHNTIGARIGSGLDIIAPSLASQNTISITSGNYYDEDIVLTIPPVSASRMWYRSPGASAMTFEATPSTTVYKLNGTKLVWDNNGVLTDVANNGDYVVYWLYANNGIQCSNGTSSDIYTIMGQSVYGTLTAAQSALTPSLPGVPTPELKLLYQVIYRQTNATTYTFVENIDKRAVSSVAGSTVSSVPNASNITLTPSGNISALNVQAGIEELDLEKASVIHTHSISAITNLQDTLDSKQVSGNYVTSVNNITPIDGNVTVEVSGGTGTNLLIDEIIVEAATTSITFTNLDGNTDGGYNVYIDIVPNSGVTTTFHLWFNGDTSSTGYRQQYLVAYAATAYILGTDNFAKIGDTTNAIGPMQCEVSVSRVGGYGMFHCRTNRLDALINFIGVVKYSATIANITSLTIISDQTNGIGIGSIIRLYKRK